MDQATFVTLSYAISSLVISGLALWIFLSARNAKSKVDLLEKQK